jgi:hypothetical protein
VSFSLYKTPFFTISCIIVDGLYKILCFFNLVLKLFFSSDLVLIEDWFILILISHEKVGLKEEGSKWKDTKHEWHAISLAKDALWSLNFKNHANYIISAPQYFFQFNFGTKVYFCYFLVSGWEMRDERKRSSNSSGKERKVSLTPI